MTSLQPGQSLSHYRLVEKIGEGGMGVVWKAHDDKLDRDVAVKVLPVEFSEDKQRLARFEREAKLLATLNHPNIATIHGLEFVTQDAGTADAERAAGQSGAGAVPVLIMELLEGERLRDRIAPGGMRWQTAAEIVAAVAEGLAAAHEKGIVHRDLKPENIFLTRDGRVKVLDFGLARRIPPADSKAETLTTPSTITVKGAIMGTIGYMSPEQLCGEPVDARSDIFSLGCVLYELLTGRQVFRRRTHAETSAATLREEPMGLAESYVQVPPALERDLQRCLEKHPDARFHSAADLAFALRSFLAGHGSSVRASSTVTARKTVRRGMWLAALVALVAAATMVTWLRRSAPTEETLSEAAPRIVVLPFKNLGEADDAYFADGMTEEITARLAAVSGLVVISRTSARHYAGTQKSIPEIGEELGADYALEGSVRWAQDEAGRSRIRVTPTLVRVADDSQLWAEIYDRVVDDVFDVQLDIARSVTDRMGVALGDSDRRQVEIHPTENLRAYQDYLRGRYWATRPHFTAENWERRMRAFEQAVELDPDFALAHAELARGHALAYYLRHDLSPERRAAAEASASRALALAPDDPRVLLNLGYYRLWAYRDIEGALSYLMRAGGDRPVQAEVFEAKGYVYALQGQWEEALDAFQRAFDLSPRNADLISEVGRALIVLRRYPEAVAATEQAISLAPDTLWPYLYKVVALWSWHGRPGETRPVLGDVSTPPEPWLRWMWFWQEMYERRYAEALGHLESTMEGWLRIKIAARPNALLTAFARERLGDTDGATLAYETARQLLEPAVAASPDDPRLHGSLGIVYAAQGRREEALREGRRACELLPKSQDGFYYIPFVLDFAHIHTLLGEHEAALEQLEYLLDNPSWVSTPFLRMDPRWDPLRNDRRFQALLERHPVER